MPVELGFILERLAASAEADAALRDRQPWKAAYEKDYAWLGGVIEKHYAGDDSDVKVLLGRDPPGLRRPDRRGVRGTSADAFLDAAPHPTLGGGCATAPTFRWSSSCATSERHGFTCFIASGGSRDFMRAITDELYGDPARARVGSSNGLRYADDEHGGSLTYLAQPDFFDDGPGQAGPHLEPHRPTAGRRGGQLERRRPDAPLRGREGPAGAPPARPPRRPRAGVRLREGRRAGARARPGRELDGRQRQGGLGDGLRP